jgi:gliding motility-associated-like protein
MVYAKHGACSTNVVGPIILNNPPLTSSFQYSIAYACPADTIHLTNMSSAPGASIINYTWEFGDGKTDSNANPTHTYLTQGNYHVVLIVSNTYCTDSMSLNLSTLHPLLASFTNPDTICRDQPITFTNTSITSQPTGVPPTFSWDFGNGSGTSTQMSPTYTYNHNDSGIHFITMVATDFVPCTSVTTGWVDILWKPYHYDYNITYCSDGVLPIGITLNDVSYKWNTGDSVCCILPPYTGVFVQTATNRCGSTDQTIGVRIDSCVKCLFVPSAFTPNGDNHDDILHVRAICPIRQFAIKIFNRYGTVVYSSNTVNMGWDGTFGGVALDLGTYFYTIEYMPDLPEARTYFMKGDVTLIR